MLDAGCTCGTSEYLLEPQLSRSFSLGREALTSAFHSEGTTGHVDHGLLQNTYSFILSPALSQDWSLSLVSFLQPFFSFCSSLSLSFSIVISRERRYTRNVYVARVRYKRTRLYIILHELENASFIMHLVFLSASTSAVALYYTPWKISNNNRNRVSDRVNNDKILMY